MAVETPVPSTKPYLVRALHEWCRDHGFTPYLTVAVDATTRVPREFVKDGVITLNISDDATGQLLIDNEQVRFSARFGGAAREVQVPMARVAAIYARENGVGMGFDVDEVPPADVAPAADEAPKPPAKKRASHLQRVK